MLPRKSNSTISQQMRQVLAELSIISETSAAQLGDRIKGGERSQAPKGPKLSLYDEHLAAWQAANGPTSKRRVLEAAEQALREAKLGKTSKYTPNTLEWRIAIATAEGSVAEITYRFGCSTKHVYRLREWHKSFRPKILSADLR